IFGDDGDGGDVIMVGRAGVVIFDDADFDGVRKASWKEPCTSSTSVSSSSLSASAGRANAHRKRPTRSRPESTESRWSTCVEESRRACSVAASEGASVSESTVTKLEDASRTSSSATDESARWITMSRPNAIAVDYRSIDR
ncbi:hypothetical protein PMAYCL1PPCAC_00726, partial [Pristionchus mayeri]